MSAYLDAARSLRPMLATASERAPEGDGWAWELKWDGMRALAAVADGELCLTNRNGIDVTARYPELAGLASACPLPAVLDGEIVALDPQTGAPSFELMQRRMHVTDATYARELAATVPTTFIAFDVLRTDESWLDAPYLERRARLAALGLDGPRWRTPPHELGDGATTRAHSIAFRLEGVMAKRTDSRYRPGARTREWLKLKHTSRQEFVVGGWLPGTGRRAATLGSLLLGVHDDVGRLRFAGAVGTGFDDATLHALHAACTRIARVETPFAGEDAGAVPREARFVEPCVVVEVRFSEWTSSGRIRHPVFYGVRDDVEPAAVTREPTPSSG